MFDQVSPLTDPTFGHHVKGTPFDLSDQHSYSIWRQAKLDMAPKDLNALLVKIHDPRNLSDAEYTAIMDRCKRANMAIYQGPTGDDPDKSIPTRLGARFGLHRLDHNQGADEDAITSLKIQTDDAHAGYIPYTNRPIAWHTDGYYNTQQRQIHGLLLHCVQPAAQGGENALLDPEIVYIQVRDQNPEFIRALMHPECMTIPANPGIGTDHEKRPDQTGPVFSISGDGSLHMRYTDRKRSIRWRDDPLSRDAVNCLKSILHTPSDWHFQARLESGWGLISNNVLHTRTGFTDGTAPRLLYRARYYDRIETRST